MKRFLLIALLIAPLCASVAGDNRPLISPKYLSQEDFMSHGIRFWAEDGTAPPPTNIPVHYMKGGDEDFPDPANVIFGRDIRRNAADLLYQQHERERCHLTSSSLP